MPLNRPAAAVASSSQALLTAMGLLAASGDVTQANGSSALTSQTLRGSLVGLVAGTLVSNLVCCITQAGAGAAPTLIRLGLFDASGNLLASTPNVAGDARWTTTGIKASAVSTPFRVPASAGYYVGMLEVGAFAVTDINVLRGGSQAAIAGGWPAAAPVVSQAGLNDLPNPAAFAGAGLAIWLGVS